MHLHGLPQMESKNANIASGGNFHKTVIIYDSSPIRIRHYVCVCDFLGICAFLSWNEALMCI